MWWYNAHNTVSYSNICRHLRFFFYFNETSSNYWIDFKNHPEAHKSFHCQKLCQIFELQFAPNGSQLELEKCCKRSFLGGGESEKSLPIERTQNPEGHWGPILLYSYNRNYRRTPHTPWKKLFLQIFSASQTNARNCAAVWLSCPRRMAKHLESFRHSEPMCMTSMGRNHEAKENKLIPLRTFWELPRYWMGSNTI